MPRPLAISPRTVEQHVANTLRRLHGTRDLIITGGSTEHA